MATGHERRHATPMLHHRIRRQRWEITAPSREVALAWRTALCDRFDAEIAPLFDRAFEKALDGVAAGAEVVRIPRLAIELSVDDVGALPERLAAALESELARAAASGGGAERTASSIEREVRRALVEYVESGRVPWEFAGHDRRWLLRSLRAESARLVSEDLPRFDAATPIDVRFVRARRLLQLIEPPERIALCGRAPSGISRATLERLVGALDSARLHSDRRGRELWVQAITDPPLWEVVGCALAAAAQSSALPTSVQLDAAAWAIAAIDPPHVADEAVASDLRALLLELPEDTIPAAVDRARRQSPEPSAAHDRRAPRASSAESRPTSAGGTLVTDGGLVLLHPFLPRLFKSTGIVAEDARAIPRAQLARAARLCHWLVGGDDDFHDFDCGAARALLGLGSDDPIPPGPMSLSDSDRAEGNELLASAVRQWAVLRDSSVDSLRSAFLARRAILRDDGRVRRLSVERSAFDVLLARLPWSIGVIALPWMNTPLHVDWTAS